MLRHPRRRSCRFVSPFIPIVLIIASSSCSVTEPVAKADIEPGTGDIRSVKPRWSPGVEFDETGGRLEYRRRALIGPGIDSTITSVTVDSTVEMRKVIVPQVFFRPTGNPPIAEAVIVGEKVVRFDSSGGIADGVSFTVSGRTIRGEEVTLGRDQLVELRSARPDRIHDPRDSAITEVLLPDGDRLIRFIEPPVYREEGLFFEGRAADGRFQVIDAREIESAMVKRSHAGRIVLTVAGVALVTGALALAILAAGFEM